MQAPIRIMLVEDDEQYREMLTEMLLSMDEVDLMGVCGSGEEFQATYKQHLPQVVLMDVQLPGQTGIETMRQVKQSNPGMQFIILTVYEDSDTLFEALRFGASGYLLKHTDPAGIIAAVKDVIEGGSPMSAAIARKVVESFRLNTQQQQVLERLTSREQEIVDLLSQGFRYKEIADRLFLSVETVRTHIRNIYEKLQVNSRTEAINKIKGWKGG